MTTPRVERDPVDDYPIFFHECLRDPEFDRIGGKLPVGPDGWMWGPDNSLTPSIHCQRCDTHGFWRGDKERWVSC